MKIVDKSIESDKTPWIEGDVIRAIYQIRQEDTPF